MLTDPEIKKAITNGYFIVTDDAGNETQVSQKHDSDNLALEITEGKTGCWRFRFTSPVTGQRTRMSLGIYPKTGLGLAREKSMAAHQQVAAGKDPILERKKEKAAVRAKRTFESVIMEWFAAFREGDTNRTQKTRDMDATKRDQLIDLFGKQLIADISIGDVQQALLKIANGDGHNAKARQLRGMLREVFEYAVPNKYCSDNPAEIKCFKLPPRKPEPLPAIISSSQVGELMRRVQAYDGRMLVTAALEVLARTFQRPANVAAMEWSEIDGNTWSIPRHKMKMARMMKPGTFHRVPLSAQVLAILELVRPLTGNGKYVFTTANKPMTPKTLNRALQQLGYGGELHCAHGFRSTASTLLNGEYRWPSDLIEMQLAHGDEDVVRKTYNRMAAADAIMSGKEIQDGLDRQWEIRVKMMAHWSTRLDELRDKDTTSNVVQLRQVA
jgi:integrase